MKKFSFLSLLITTLMMGLSFSACEEGSSILEVIEEEGDNTDGTDDQSTPEISIEEGDNTASTTVYVSDLETDATEVNVNVTFVSTDTKMRRLYMTQNIAGAGAEKYELEMEGLDKKGDGSLDLSSDNGYEFTYKIPFPVLSDVEEGTVEYQIWTTSGRGDYRDTEKRMVGGPGTIIINYGGENPTTVEVKEYTAKMLAAPLADGSSETFISLVDGDLYRIDEGEEYVAYWDFGYYYGSSNAASLASTFDYPSAVIDIETIANTTSDELNHTYFAQSNLSVNEFDAIATSSDLDFISESATETVTNLGVDDVIEFVDNYGKKGIIKVVDINGTWNSGDYIELAIKVQP